MVKEERDFRIIGKKAILHIEDRVFETPSELLESRVFREALQRAAETLQRKNSPLLRVFGEKVEERRP